MAEPKTPPSETYDEATGMTNVDPNVFVEGEEGQGEENKGEETTPEEEKGKGESTSEQPSEGGNETPSGEEGKETKPDDKPETPDKGEETLYAGKFKTVEDMQKAYQELGGDPSRFSKPELLEEAYLVRQAEFTRSRQAVKPDERKTDPEPDTQPEDEQIVSEIVERIDYSKVQNAKDAIREAVKASMEIMKKYNKPQLSEQELVEKLSPAIADRERKVKELTSLEGEVPRLKTDGFFRQQFAHFVMNKQREGTFVNLKKTMVDFLNNYASLAEEAGKIREQSAKQKQAANPAPDRGEGLPTKEHKDEADEIMEAFGARKAKFGN